MTNSPADTWWKIVDGDELEQGFILTGVAYPQMYASTLLKLPPTGGKANVHCVRMNVITVTHSCDWPGATRALVSKVLSVREAREHGHTDEDMQDIRDGRRPEWVALAGPKNPSDKEDCIIVDLRWTVSLPAEYLKKHALTLTDRIALRSPYLEYFSAAFGRCFSRVALPKDSPVFAARQRTDAV